MKIYTKAGDRGSTSLLGGVIVAKDDLRVEAYGNIDELNASLGLVYSTSELAEVHSLLRPIQNDLFTIGAELSSKGGKVSSISPFRVNELEAEIDRMDGQMPPLTNFILPGGSVISAQLHLARTICRRAERRVVTLSKSEKINPDIIIYLNRLSDFLFVLARFVNYQKKIPDVLWKGK
ncbi:MAG: cob(I)yrinic acid a,c-diamide adenosyltransferase [Candidatus Bilamarchaeum sp.]